MFLRKLFIVQRNLKKIMNILGIVKEKVYLFKMEFVQKNFIQENIIIIKSENYLT